jgi:hypothetical protein
VRLPLQLGASGSSRAQGRETARSLSGPEARAGKEMNLNCSHTVRPGGAAAPHLSKPSVPALDQHRVCSLHHTHKAARSRLLRLLRTRGAAGVRLRIDARCWAWYVHHCRGQRRRGLRVRVVSHAWQHERFSIVHSSCVGCKIVQQRARRAVGVLLLSWRP